MAAVATAAASMKPPRARGGVLRMQREWRETNSYAKRNEVEGGDEGTTVWRDLKKGEGAGARDAARWSRL